MMAAKTSKTPRRTIAPGFWVAVVLREPLRMSCYVGQVQVVDNRGFRITLIDWVIGTAGGWDLYVPWDNVLGMLVATPDHDLKLFGEEAGKFQTAINEARSPVAPTPPSDTAYGEPGDVDAS